MDLEFKPVTRAHGWELPCAFCERTVTEGAEELEIETQKDPEGPNRFVRVWHKECHEEYLDQGEET